MSHLATNIGKLWEVCLGRQELKKKHFIVMVAVIVIATLEDQAVIVEDYKFCKRRRERKRQKTKPE